MNFKSLKKGDCPVCNGERGDCRENTANGIIHCRSQVNPSGFKYLGDDQIGFGMWVPANANDSGFDRAEWQRRKREPKPLPQVMSLEERDRHLQDWLAKASLNNEDRSDLERRGITNFSIALSGKPGYGVPFKGLHGHFVGMQWKAKDPSIAGKYPWYNLPKGKHYPGTNELPIAVCKVDSPKGLVLVEGTGVKPILAAERLGMIAIGASGGNHIASQTQLKEVFDAFPDLPVTIAPDAGDIINPHLTGEGKRYARTVKVLRQWGIEPKFWWWGQFTKAENDVDEATQAEIESARSLSWEEFEALGKQDQPVEYPSCDIAEQIERDLCEAAQAKERLAGTIGECNNLLAQIRQPEPKKKRDRVEPIQSEGFTTVKIHDRDEIFNRLVAK